MVKMGVWPGDMNQEYIIVKMHKNGREGGQGGCERRIEVIVKMQKKNGCAWGEGGVRPGSVRVDMNLESVIVKTQKKNLFITCQGDPVRGVRSGGEWSGWM